MSVQETPEAVTLLLEGKCRGPWVEELKQSWHKADAARGRRRLRVDLGKVGFVDGRGKELLAEMCAQGVQLLAVGPLMTSLVEEIVARCAGVSKQRA